MDFGNREGEEGRRSKKILDSFHGWLGTKIENSRGKSGFPGRTKMCLGLGEKCHEKFR